MVSITDDAAIISAVAMIIGTVIILLELQHMETHRNVEISMKLFEWGESDRLRKAFKWIEREFQFKDYDHHKAQEEVSIEAGDYPYEVAAYFEQVGFLVQKKFVDFDVIVDRISPFIISNWKKLEPWIIALRKEKGDKTFGDHFQKLYERTIEYTKKS